MNSSERMLTASAGWTMVTGTSVEEQVKDELLAAPSRGRRPQPRSQLQEEPLDVIDQRLLELPLASLAVELEPPAGSCSDSPAPATFRQSRPRCADAVSAPGRAAAVAAPGLVAISKAGSRGAGLWPHLARKRQSAQVPRRLPREPLFREAVGFSGVVRAV